MKVIKVNNIINFKHLFVLVTAIGIISSFSQRLNAQDPEFSQFYAATSYLNPSMIGFGEAPRFIFSVRDQLTSFDNAYVTAFAGYDQYFHKFKSSVGVNVMADFAGGIYNTYNVNALYAYQLKLNNKYAVKAALQAGFWQQSIDIGDIIYADMIDPASAVDNIGTNTAEQPLERTSLIRFDLGAGILIFSENLFAGISAKHLTTPNLSFTGNDDIDNELQMKISAHAGYSFKFGKTKVYGEEPFEIAPNVLFSYQGKFKQLNVGAWLGKNKIFGGLWVRHTLSNFDALIAMLGYRVDMFKIAYSYDQTISGIKTNAGAHELSVTIDLGNNDYYKRQQRLRDMGDCPALFK